jgi:hypothetical protein
VSLDNKLTFAVNQPYPTVTQAVDLDPFGYWPTITISYRIVAWQTADETDPNFAGIEDAANIYCDNISVSAGNNIVIYYTAPTRTYDHLAFYYQVASTFNVENPCTKCTMVAYSTYISVVDNDNSASITFGGRTAVINPATLSATVIRQTVKRGWNGLLISTASALSTLVDSLEVSGIMTSITTTQYAYILKWIRDSIPVTMTDSIVGSNQPFIDIYEGYLTNTTYICSPDKNPEGEDTFTLTFMVDGETIL